MSGTIYYFRVVYRFTYNLTRSFDKDVQKDLLCRQLYPLVGTLAVGVSDRKDRITSKQCHHFSSLSKVTNLSFYINTGNDISVFT